MEGEKRDWEEREGAEEEAEKEGAFVALEVNLSAEVDFLNSPPWGVEVMLELELAPEPVLTPPEESSVFEVVDVVDVVVVIVPDVPDVVVVPVVAPVVAVVAAPDVVAPIVAPDASDIVVAAVD